MQSIFLYVEISYILDTSSLFCSAINLCYTQYLFITSYGTALSDNNILFFISKCI